MFGSHWFTIVCILPHYFTKHMFNYPEINNRNECDCRIFDIFWFFFLLFFGSLTTILTWKRVRCGFQCISAIFVRIEVDFMRISYDGGKRLCSMRCVFAFVWRRVYWIWSKTNVRYGWWKCFDQFWKTQKQRDGEHLFTVVVCFDEPWDMHLKRKYCK